MSPPIVRFAPSPTGRIHIGNARTALMNFLYARKHHGQFILRFDDTDMERSKEEYAQAIEVDLAWLGIVPDLTFRQSQRAALYRAAADSLRAAGRLYPCYETAEELDRRRKRQQARGLPPIYDRAALALTPEDRARLVAQAQLIEAYERARWPRRPPGLPVLLAYLMDQHGLTRADLVPLLGTASRVSEVLSGKRELSMTMVKKLRDRFNIPADVLIPVALPRKAVAA